MSRGTASATLQHLLHTPLRAPRECQRSCKASRNPHVLHRGFHKKECTRRCQWELEHSRSLLGLLSKGVELGHSIADILYEHVAVEMGWEVHPSFEAAVRAANPHNSSFSGTRDLLNSSARELFNSSLRRRLAKTSGQRSSSRSTHPGQSAGGSATAGAAAGGGGLAALGGMLSLMPPDQKSKMKSNVKVIQCGMSMGWGEMG